MSHVNSHQRVAEGIRKNLVDYISCSVILFFLQQAHKQNFHHDSDGGYVWVEHHGLPFTCPDLVLVTAECLY